MLLSINSKLKRQYYTNGPSRSHNAHKLYNHCKPCSLPCPQQIIYKKS